MTIKKINLDIFDQKIQNLVKSEIDFCDTHTFNGNFKFLDVNAKNNLIILQVNILSINL